MKLKKRNILYSLLIGLTLISGVSTVDAAAPFGTSADGRKTIFGTYTMGSYSAYVKHIMQNDSGGASGTVSTHVMSFTYTDTDGTSKTIPAYCAWYEKSSPSGIDTATFKSLTDAELNQKYKVGLATIINDPVTICNKYDTNKLCSSTGSYSGCYSDGIELRKDDCVRSMRTTALNLYLSVEGQTSGISGATSDRFDSIINNWGQFKNLGQLQDFNSDGYTNSHDLLQMYQNGDSDAERDTFWKKIHSMVTTAQTAQANYENKIPTLNFVESEDEESFELTSDETEYKKVFQVESNYTIISLEATVDGYTLGDDYRFTTDLSKNTITVFIKKEVYDAAVENETIESMKVVAKAKINIEKVEVYITDESGYNRDKMQDLMLVIPDKQYVEVSTGTIPLPTYKTCYSYDMLCDTTGCTNTNQNNTRNCSSSVSTYSAITCDSTDLSNNASGTKTYEVPAGGCALYCTEKASASYPGNVGEKINLGQKIVWPTANGTGLYPLTTEGTLTCKLIMNDGSSANGTCISEASKILNQFTYDNAGTGTITYNDLKENKELSLKGDCTSTPAKFIDSVTIEISNSCKYSLDNESYNAFNKKTLEAIEVEKENFNSAPGTVVLNTEGFLPITGLYASDFTDLNSVLSGKYDLKISGISLGHNGQFTELLNNTEYVCKYKVTDQMKCEKCTCPPGTAHAGKSLVSLLKNASESGNSMTCADAMEKYCNSCEYKSCYCQKGETEVNLENCLNEGKSYSTCTLENGCTDSRIVCDESTNFPGLSLECCLSEGYSYDECVSKTCYSYCPPESHYPERTVTTCINDKMVADSTLDMYDAYELCVEEECYDYPPCTGVNCIIYRTISLEIPFVGKNVKDSGAWSSIYSKYYNWMHLGGADISQGLALYRYPGANWKSPTLVSNKIWYNRGYKASEMYQEATPLYTINLDPSSIKQIRDYNKNHEYSDFTLSCTDGAYCISSFLRNTSFTNADGSAILDRSATASTCANASNKTTFISCYKHKVTS